MAINGKPDISGIPWLRTVFWWAAMIGIVLLVVEVFA